jgi:hypothetical protein
MRQGSEGGVGVDEGGMEGVAPGGGSLACGVCVVQAARINAGRTIQARLIFSFMRSSTFFYRSTNSAKMASVKGCEVGLSSILGGFPTKSKCQPGGGGRVQKTFTTVGVYD